MGRAAIALGYTALAATLVAAGFSRISAALQDPQPAQPPRPTFRTEANYVRVGVMTPYMSAADITFARKTTTIEGFLARYWTWGERNQINSTDPVEDDYRMCFPGFGPSRQCSDDDRGVADEMIERRREKLTLDALSDLARYL